MEQTLSSHLTHWASLTELTFWSRRWRGHRRVRKCSARRVPSDKPTNYPSHLPAFLRDARAGFDNSREISLAESSSIAFSSVSPGAEHLEANGPKILHDSNRTSIIASNSSRDSDLTDSSVRTVNAFDSQTLNLNASLPRHAEGTRPLPSVGSSDRIVIRGILNSTDSSRLFNYPIFFSVIIEVVIVSLSFSLFFVGLNIGGASLLLYSFLRRF